MLRMLLTDSRMTHSKRSEEHRNVRLCSDTNWSHTGIMAAHKVCQEAMFHMLLTDSGMTHSRRPEKHRNVHLCSDTNWSHVGIMTVHSTVHWSHNAIFV